MKKSIPFIMSIILICFTNNVKAQLASELAFSLGPVFVPHSTIGPTGDVAPFAAGTGFGVQADYKLMNKNVGLQLSFSYVLNTYDGDYAYNVLNAYSYNCDKWNAMMGLIKFVGRAMELNDKLLIDFALGFGIMQGSFSRQSFVYEDNYAPEYQVKEMYSPEKISSGMVVSAGFRVSYKLGNKMGILVNWDYLYGAQNYSVVYKEANPTVDPITKMTRLKRNYSVLLFGVFFPF